MKRLQVGKRKEQVQKKMSQRHAKAQAHTQVQERPYLQAQGIIGNHGMLRFYESDVIPPELYIGSLNDKYEREADRVADMVVGTSNHTNLQQVPSTAETLVQRHMETPSAIKSVGIPDSVKSVISSGNGRQLDKSNRKFMEQSFDDCDFSHVRIHTDGPAAESARAINARAYTAGRDVVFGAGEYAPHTIEGKKLLAHELAHCINQMKDGKYKTEWAYVQKKASGAPSQAGQKRRADKGAADRGVENIATDIYPPPPHILEILDTVHLMIDASRKAGYTLTAENLEHYIKGGGRPKTLPRVGNYERAVYERSSGGGASAGDLAGHSAQIEQRRSDGRRPVRGHSFRRLGTRAH